MPIDKHFRRDLDLTKIDWAKADATSDAEIRAQAETDEDTAPILSVEELFMAVSPKPSAHRSRSRASPDPQDRG